MDFGNMYSVEFLLKCGCQVRKGIRGIMENNQQDALYRLI